MAFQPSPSVSLRSTPHLASRRSGSSLDLAGGQEEQQQLFSPVSFSGNFEALHKQLTDTDVVEEEEEEEEELVYDRVPLMGETKMVIDDRDSTYVIMFPRQKDKHGDGAVNAEKTRHYPRRAWMRIFRQKREDVPHEPCSRQLQKDSMPEREFQRLVRQKLLTIFRDSGLKAWATESVDKDEVFLRLSLDREGLMIRQLAQRLQYKMAFKRELYSVNNHVGCYARGVKMNDEGVEVLHYEAYNPEIDDKIGEQCGVEGGAFEPFSTVDEVRLLWMHLNSQVSLQALVDEKVTSGDFPGAQYHVMKKLSCDWADWQNMFLLPSEKDEEEVRAYFGEEIAFFFRWLGMWARMLGVLSVICVVFYLRNLPTLGVTMIGRDIVKIAFGIVVIFWGALFQKMNKQSSARVVQAWGMDGWEATEPSLPDYKPEEEGTEVLKLKKTFVQVVVVFYLICFVTLISFMQWRFFKMAQHNEGVRYPVIKSFILSNQSTILSVLIKLFSFIWRKLASPIVQLGNYRTQTRLNDALITNLSIVKLFVSLFPFFHTAVIKNILETSSGKTLSEAAHKVYKTTGWPVPERDVLDIPADGGDYIPLSALGFLKGFWHFDSEQQLYVIDGCHPVACQEEAAGLLTGSGGAASSLHCKTNCLQDIQSSMKWLFVIQLGSCIFWTMVPIVFTWMEVQKEMSKARKMAKPNEAPKYSFIQMQAKCYREAKYGFQEYGGSYVEDFMEMAISHALLACFGMVCPQMSIIAFACILMQYRLLAYRLTNVTCRPMPRGSMGIGIWGDLFGFVSFLSVFFTSLLAVTSLLPMRNWPLWKQAVAFALGEKMLMLLRDIFSSLLPDVPSDVTFLHDFNNEFRKTFFKRKLANANEKADYRSMDIGLRPRADRPRLQRLASGSSGRSLERAASSASEEEEEEEDSPRGVRGALRDLWNASPMAEFFAV